MSMMGNSGPNSEDPEPEMKEQRRKNISDVLQRLSDKQSSGYESEKETDLYTQTPTEPRIPLIPEYDQDDPNVSTNVGEHSTMTKTVHEYTEYEYVRESKMKHEGWIKYQQEVVQKSSSSHSVCYPIPKQLPSSPSAYPSSTQSSYLSELEQKQLQSSREQAYPRSSFAAERPSTPPPSQQGTQAAQYSREPVIVARQQSPFYRPHLWKSPTHGASYAKGSAKPDQSYVTEETMCHQASWKAPHGKGPIEEPSRTIELFPPPECISGGGEKTETQEADSEKKKESTTYPKSFKKYLQERYISSLKDTESKESAEHSRPRVPETIKKRLDEVRFEPERQNPSFSSTDSEGRGEASLPPEVFIHVRDAEQSPSRREEEEAAESKDDVFETSEYMDPRRRGQAAASSSPSKEGHSRATEEPLDLRSIKLQQPLASPFMSQESSVEEMRSPAPFPAQLSPSMYHHSPPMFYSPQHEMVSPRSPLWSVPEGRVFNFNLTSPFEPRCHSDPEFLSPGFSPDSPGLHFTFPPRSPYLGSGGEHSRMPKSPRLIYPGSPSRFPGSSTKPLPKLFCSPPPVSEFTQQTEGPQGAELTYICPVCGQVFPSYDNLAKHMAKHLPTETVKTADNNKVHYCKVCNRAFSRSDMLTRHMRLHTGLKPYECRVCGQVFSRSDHLNTHQRTHTGEKPYRCPQCPYAACRRDMITRHMRIHLKRSSKRGKYLAVPEGESSDVRKSSVSSTDTTDSQEHSGRTCSVSSIDSVDSEGGSRKCSVPSGESFETEGQPQSSGSRLWSSASAESTDFEDSSHFRQSSSAFYADSPGPFLEPTFTYRKSRNWSTTSFESIDSEGSGSRRDSVADDFGDMDTKESTENQSSRETPIIDDDSLRKFTISSDDI